ncbi:thermonuclease family protein [Novosphingobium sp.]|uniref:thermonuclease family protein n=1 Tax=Novosphingobium sp. TaxID=1874826 RepID=UPI0025FC1E49|nr:thermonuclease family protein [Novosphingobium sp.]
MLLLALSLAAAPVCIARVHDGDTVRLCSGERIRIEDIDAPELFRSQRCSPAAARRLEGSRNPPWCDYTKGERARDALALFLAHGPVKLKRTGTDRYGRTLARIWVNGVDAGRYLISRGLARRWR